MLQDDMSLFPSGRRGRARLLGIFGAACVLSVVLYMVVRPTHPDSDAGGASKAQYGADADHVDEHVRIATVSEAHAKVRDAPVSVPPKKAKSSIPKAAVEVRGASKYQLHGPLAIMPVCDVRQRVIQLCCRCLSRLAQ